MDHAQIASMLSPTTYPEPTSVVQHLQTHISHLFLTDSFVYKIKKPVDFGFLDFSTLEKRRFYCNEELRLNRRLSPDIYLGVVELHQSSDGHLNLAGDGTLVEYAVKMKRMPEAQMMSRMLERGEVTERQIDAIAERVARFHAEADRDGGIALFGTVEAITANWLENLRQTKPYLGRTVAAQDHGLIAAWALQQLEQKAGDFRERIRNGFIRECDGDLHSENICLDGDHVHIFDCIEFNDKFRYSDTAADVAFLAMDLENHGRRDLAERFVNSYATLSGDRRMRKILPLYLANRAFIRGKVESFRLDDPLISITDKEAAADRARRFFRLARGYVLREKLPQMLFMTCGLTGSGKSSLATELAFQLGLDHLSSDAERKRLAGLKPTERGADIYGDAWNQATYGRLLELAGQRLAAGQRVVVDATFRTKGDRKQFLQLAADIGAVAVILLLVCPEEVARQRLEQRTICNDAVSDGTWQVYQHQAVSFERPTEEEGCVMAIHAVNPVVEQVDAIIGDLLQTVVSDKIQSP